MIIEKLSGSLKPLPFIYALWLEGADATGMVDQYSDIDFWVDFEDEFEEQAIAAVETALSQLAPIDYKHVINHDHPKIRQRVYHLAGTSKYLMIDFCWQLHSRPSNEYSYQKDDPIENAKVIFDKADIIRYTAQDLDMHLSHNRAMLDEAKYRRTQHLRAEKYVHRGQYLEAYAYYNCYVLAPLIDLLRLIHTPAYADWYLVHISRHIPPCDRARLEYFAQVGSIDDIAERIALAGQWFDELVAKLG